MNRSEESNRARSLSALVEELEDEEDEDLLVLKKFRSEKKKHSRYQKKYIKSLSAEGKKNRDHRVARSSLQSPHKSVWVRVYESNSDSGLLTVTGLPRDAFEELLGYFAPIYLAHSPVGGIDGFCKEINTKIGRPHDLNAAGCLGLALSRTRTRGALWHLAVNFGLTISTAHDWLGLGLVLIFLSQSYNQEKNMFLYCKSAR